MVRINHKAPEFTAQVFHEGKIKKIDSNDYKGKWLIVMFYPADFTFICPTELGDFSDKYEQI